MSVGTYRRKFPWRSSIEPSLFFSHFFQKWHISVSLSSLDFHTPYVYQGPCYFNIAEVESRAGKTALPRRSDVADCNGKEKDWESGFHLPRRGFEHHNGKYNAVKNYGARYYWSELLAGWLSVDPMADKYPGISPYAYCAWNPIKLVDPNGEEISDHIDENGYLIAHYDDGDDGVYVHANGTTKTQIDNQREVLGSTGGIGLYIGDLGGEK